MVLTALRGALGFLTTVPVGMNADSWESFRAAPVTAVLVGYPVGVLSAIPLVVLPPGPVAGAAFVIGGYLVTGINHADGLTDVADALAVHGERSDRIAAMEDSAVGVGGTLALGLVLLGLFAAGRSLTGAGWAALGVVVAAEVGAKLGVLIVLARGTPRASGLGASVAAGVTRRSLPVGIGLSVPAVSLALPSAAGGVALLSAALVGVGAVPITRSRFGGTNGDVLGATNELARLVGLSAGVTAWTLW
ncbi:MAG: adenosylcobinamide-GDP ribazoletransferase [Halanaeroarchaeum sp.]